MMNFEDEEQKEGGVSEDALEETLEEEDESEDELAEEEEKSWE